ncbi:MAG: methyl-accepting chemotaxis protein [Desulfococcaceae bacterium]|jgi:methyl-accepting chemotaxis protein|nr:methyl-accepting chemotaxis protein [Desulfococcaceae bacterium]
MKIKGSLRKLRVRLLIAFLIVAVIPVCMLGFISWQKFSNALEDQVFKQLESVREIKKAQIKDYFDARQDDMDVLIETVSTLRAEAIQKLEAVRETQKKQMERFFYERTGDVLVLADNPFIHQALRELGSAFEDGGGTAGGNFKGSNEEKYEAPYGYREVHDRYYPNLKYYIKQYAYYDLFLMTGDGGDICFTVMKESDFGQRTGDMDSGSLRDAWRIAAKEGRVAVSDIKPYGPSAGAPAQFAAAPVKENGRIIGVVALQISMDAINEIMSERTGLGESGETYLVGPDQLMRSDAFLDPENRSIAASFKDPSKGSISTEAAKEALAGKTDAKVISGYRGKPVLSAYTPVRVGDMTWGLIAETDIAEAFCPKNESDSYFFARYKEIYGYYDLFLINPDGYCFYTVVREPDYQTNLLNGRFADSGLGRLTRNVLASGRFAFADFEPYEPSQYEPAAFIAKPLIRNGKTELVVALQISLDSISRIMNQRAGMLESGETYLVGSDSLMRSDSFLDPANYSVKASFANPDSGKVRTDASMNALSGKTGQESTFNYQKTPVLSSYTLLNVWDAKWALLAEVGRAEAFEALKNIRIWLAILGFVSLALILLITFLAIRIIIKPIRQVVEQFRLLATGEGDLTQRVDLGTVNCSRILQCGKHECRCYGKSTHCWYEAGSYAVDIQCPKILSGTYKSCEECREVYQKAVYDEVTSLASYFNAFMSKLQEMIKTVTGSVGIMSASASALSEISEKMTGRAVSMSEKANAVATATEEMSANMNSVATASEEASTNVKMVATATEEMAATVNEIAQNSEKARVITNEAVHQGKSASDKVNLLGTAANEISKVTELITEISEQTNLLALNATIEAARAGEAGKGFAVVANEIKELARQTPEATQDIRNKIEGIQNSTAETVKEIGQISDVINKVNEIVSIIATAVEEQSVTTREIAGNIANASVGIEEVNHNVAQSSAVAVDIAGDIADLNESAAEISDSISQVNVNAEELSGLAAQLKRLVDKFRV